MKDSQLIMCRVINNTNNTVKIPGLTTVGIARRISPGHTVQIPVGTKGNDKIDPVIENPELSDQDRNRLKQFLLKHSDVFASDISDIGCTHLMSHKIDTGDTPPKAKRFYRASPKVREEIERQVEELLACGFIEPSTSEWTSPVVLVKKRDGSFRFAVDYRHVNAVTKPMSFPVPRLEDIWDAIGAKQAKIYSTIDLAGAFWQIPIHPESKDKTSFVTQGGQYSWRRMPFGLRNASVSFQKLIAEIFRGLTYKIMAGFIDDIIVFSSDLDQHMKDLDLIFDRLRKANLKAKPTKCRFGTNSVKYLGHILSSEGILPNPEKTKVIVDYLFISRICRSISNMSLNVIPNNCAYEDAVHNQPPIVGLFTCRCRNGGVYHSEATRKVGPRNIW